jgi:gas vesicle protein
MATFGRRSTAKQWARMAMKVGLLLTDMKLWSTLSDQLKERAGDVRDNFRDNFKDRYDDTADRIQNAGSALRGENNWVSPVASFVGGVGVGIAVGMLFAPVSGEEARAVIRDRARDVGSKVNEMTGSRFQATGTEGD